MQRLVQTICFVLYLCSCDAWIRSAALCRRSGSTNREVSAPTTALRSSAAASANSLEDLNVLLSQSMTGIKLSNVRVENFLNENIRGMRAVNSIDEGSIPVVVVPHRYALEVTNDRPPTPFPGFVSQQLWEQSMWYSRLAFKLLHELKVLRNNSIKLVWLDQLPKAFSTPFHWSDEEIDDLQYPSLKNKIAVQRKEWRELYQRWMSDNDGGQGPKDVSLSEFIWALECVNSRAFSGVYEGSSAKQRGLLLMFTGALSLAWPLLHLGTFEQSLSAAVVVGLSIVARDVIFSRSGSLKRYVLCPVVDFFNHRSDCSSDVSYNYFADQFEVRAGRYAQGEQVFISYGRQSNDRLLQYYGFVEDHNPNDSYDFGVGVLELILKYIGDPDHGLPLPTLPPPAARLQQISLALRNTRVDDSASTGTKTRSSIQAGDEVHARYFRCKPVGPDVQTAGGVPRRSSSLAAGDDDEVSNHFDDVTVRSLRALLCSPDEWRLLFPDPSTVDEEASLERLGLPGCPETERLVTAALTMILRLELEGKPTTLTEDLSSLASLQASSSAISPRTAAATAEQEVNPSGRFSVVELSTLKFRIEKKMLLQEGISLHNR